VFYSLVCHTAHLERVSAGIHTQTALQRIRTFSAAPSGAAAWQPPTSPTSSCCAIPPGMLLDPTTWGAKPARKLQTGVREQPNITNRPRTTATTRNKQQAAHEQHAVHTTAPTHRAETITITTITTNTSCTLCTNFPHFPRRAWHEGSVCGESQQHFHPVPLERPDGAHSPRIIFSCGGPGVHTWRDAAKGEGLS
jgi:hypothetical protein